MTTMSTAAPSRERLVSWGFLAPFLIAFALFLVWPLVHGLYLSVTNQSLTGAGGSWVGFDNYREALTDPTMWRALRTTVWFTVVSTIPLVILALVMALLVHRGLPGQWLWRLSFFMPFLLASTVISQIWVWIFNPDIGAANSVLGALGIEPIAWLQDPAVNLYAIVIATVWWTVGFNFLLYLAALQGIPAQVYEAAAIDGANGRQKLFRITLPLLSRTTGLIIVLQLVASLKIFDQIYLMTNGGPNYATRPIIQYIYQNGFTNYRIGYASAISYMFFAIIVIVSVLQFKLFSGRKEGV